MAAAPEVGLSPDLGRAIQDRIAQRTRVRIQTLEIQMAGDRIVITGWVPSFYLKQLVIEGVLDAVGRSGTHRIELNVQVPCDTANTDVGAG
jgi:hypothetical protein